MAHLPGSNISRKETGVAALSDEGFDRIAHAPGPVFIMAYAEHQTVRRQQLRAKFQITADRIVHFVSVLLQPSDHNALPIVESPRIGRPAYAGALIDQTV